MTPEQQAVARLELAAARLMLRLEAELDDTAAVAIVHDCGVDADRLRVIGTRFYAEEEERRHDRG